MPIYREADSKLGFTVLGLFPYPLCGSFGVGILVGKTKACH